MSEANLTQPKKKRKYAPYKRTSPQQILPSGIALADACLEDFFESRQRSLISGLCGSTFRGFNMPRLGVRLDAKVPKIKYEEETKA